MACFHNENKIIILETEIKKLENDIDDLNANVKVYKKSIEDYSGFYEKIKCVENNIIKGDNHITSKSFYDNGDMSVTLKLTMNQIDDCTSNIAKCKEEIMSINEEIAAKREQIASLQGDCEVCAAAKEESLSSSSTKVTTSA